MSPVVSLDGIIMAVSVIVSWIAGILVIVWKFDKRFTLVEFKVDHLWQVWATPGDEREVTIKVKKKENGVEVEK